MTDAKNKAAASKDAKTEEAAAMEAPAGDPVAQADPAGHDAPTQAIDLEYSPGVPAAKADVTLEHIVADPQADVLAWDPKPISTGDPTVPRADSHDPRPDAPAAPSA